MLTRLARAWRASWPERRLAAVAALLLFTTMFLPWYQQNVLVSDSGSGGQLASGNLTAFQVFSFVEAAVLLVAVAVLALLFARAEGRAFHLPGGDGAIVTLAGGWVALLLVWRLFDKPDLQGAGVGTMGVQWGIFVALAAAALLASSGVRMRAADAEAPAPPARVRRPRRRPPAPGTERTRPLPPEQRRTPRHGPPAGTTETPAAETRPTETHPSEPPTAQPPTEPLSERGRRRPRQSPQSERLWDDR